MISVCKTFTFEAAHYLPNYEGKCRNIHGHSFTLEIEVSGTHQVLIGEGPKQGMVMDFGDLKEVVQREVIEKLDQTLLNDTIANPTAENILVWIRHKLECLPYGMLRRLRLYETPDSYAELKTEEVVDEVEVTE